jgi:hypothetical protein
MDEKLSQSIMSPTPILCADANVIVTVDEPLVVVNADVRLVVDLIGCTS